MSLFFNFLWYKISKIKGIRFKKKDVNKDRNKKIEGFNRYELMVISVNIKDIFNSFFFIFFFRKIIDRELYINKKELRGWRILKKCNRVFVIFWLNMDC